MSNIPTVKLSNGKQMPVLGLGTYKEDSEEKLVTAVKAAVKAGYRHFDCAYCYHNEEHIGRGIREAIAESNGKLKREDFFIVSKCWNQFHAKDKVGPSLDQCLARFGLDYLDLYLMHWPMDFKEGDEDIHLDSNGKVLYTGIHYLETYKAMEELVTAGKAKSIGISNFNIEQVKDVLANCTIKPVCNQVEAHPIFNNAELVSFCQKNDIVVVAYAPLGASDRPWAQKGEPILIEQPFVLEIANKHSKSPAQVLLKWNIQRGVVVIPKSVTPERIEENTRLFDFELSEEEMKTLSSFKPQHRFYKFDICDQHPFYPFEKN